MEFADYRCGACKEAFDAILRIIERFTGKVKVVYMDLPVTGGASASVARGGACADKQGRFWDYHDQACQQQAPLDKESPVALAKAIGLDIKAFEDCLGSEMAAASVEKFERKARRLQLSSTPSIFVNGRRVVTQDIEADLAWAVDAALAE